MTERINWKDASRHDKGALGVDIRMLDGHEITKICHKSGDKLSDEKIERTIVYDRDYLVHKATLCNASLLKLGKTKYLALQKEIWEKANGQWE